MTGIKQDINAKTHVYRKEADIPCERKILSRYTAPGSVVLDVGCGAIGRSARLLQEFGCEVYSIDINADAIREFSASESSRGITTLVADATALPFEDGFFDLVLVALHGLDYLLPLDKRIGTLRELNRVLKKTRTSYLVFNTLNPLGVITSPRGLANISYLKWRLKQLACLRFMGSTLKDLNGLTMYQAFPGSVISQVTRATNMEPELTMNWGGKVTNRFLLTLFSSGPYYVFKNPAANAT